LQALLIFRGGHGREAAGLDIRDACLSGSDNLLFLQAGIVDQAKHCFLDECSRTRGPAFGDLPFDYALQFVGKLNSTHGVRQFSSSSIR
jgi:hypothetical protein